MNSELSGPFRFLEKVCSGIKDDWQRGGSRILALAVVLALIPAGTAPAQPGQASSKVAPQPPHTNALADETSPYLLQHAHNPVNWRPWGQAALDLARQQGKLIFLSVGYSSCHWCHVMEHESFEDEAIARFMNENFICIKVDREERPDVDAIYMLAVQLMTGRGGWPLSVFLTPNAKPFFGGTYFPARDGDRPGKRRFPYDLRTCPHHFPGESPRCERNSHQNR